MLYLTPAIFILFSWIMIFSGSPLLQSQVLLKLLAVDFGLSIGVSYFIILTIFRITILIKQK
jgi:hypothetical protein